MMQGDSIMEAYLKTIGEPVHLITRELSAMPRNAISRQLANPRIRPAFGEIPTVMPIRKPSTKESIKTGSTNFSGIFSPRFVMGKGLVLLHLVGIVFSTLRVYIC
jgi:hypothetical protein